MDLGTIQYNVEANTTGIDKTNAAVENMAERMDDAGKSADNLGKKIITTGNSASAASGGVDKASGAVTNFGANAGRAGIQIQQFVGQIQGGQSAFVALSQQAADLGIVLGAPLVGVVVSLGAVIAGTLLPSLFNTGEQVKAVSDLTKELVKDFKDFSDAQKLVINKGVAVSLVAETDALSKKKKEVGELTRALNEQKKAYAALPSGGTGRGGSGARQAIEDTIKYKEANASLVKSQLEVVDIEKRIKELRDPTGSDKKTKSLSDEAAITGLVGRAYWELKAAQEGVADSRKEEYIAAGLSLDKKKEEIKTAKELAQEAERLEKKREAAAVRDLAAEKSRADNIQKMIASMKEEADLYGDVSREAKTRYEIENGFIKAKTQAEKEALITQAKRIDQLNDEKALQEAIDAEIKDREDETKKAQAKSDAELKARSEKIADLINDGLMRGFESGKGIIENFRDTVENVFKTLVLRPSIEIATAELSKAVGGVLGSVGKRDETGKTVGAQGLLGKIGANGVIGLAIGASLISSWNAKQDAKFAKLESAYRQGVQSTGTVFGEANKKSESIANSISNLGDTAANTLDVNHEMYQALLDIREGITGVAAGFARTVDTSSLTSGIKTGQELGGISSGLKSLYNKTGLGQITGSLGTLGGFINGAFDKVASLISSKKTSVIDSGIKIVGSNLADILEKGTIEAFSYADVKTTKKFLGVTTSTKVKESTQALDDLFEKQFADVFINAGDALQQASKVFAVAFDPAKFIVDASKLSLKGLEGDALTAEIERFFSSTLDTWATTLVGGTDALMKFQQVGEGAFETIIRLASETNTFAQYADLLNLKFSLVGIGAIDATEEIAKLSGGFDNLAGSLASYYRNFFTDSERTAKGLSQISDELAKVGLELPTTREGFKALVDAQDLNTESGRAPFAVLMNLQGAFADLVPATKAATDAVADMTKVLNDSANAAYDSLTRAIDSERQRLQSGIENANKAKSALEASVGAEKDKITEIHNAKLADLKAQADAERAAQEAINKARIDSLEDQRSAIEDSIKGLQSLIGGINNAIGDMAIKSNALTAARRRAAEFEIETALRNARAGRLPTMESLSGALGNIGGDQSSIFSSSIEMARANAITQNQLKAISDIAGTKLSSDEQMLAAVTSQLDIAKSTKEVISTKFDEQIALENDAYEKQIASLDLIVQNAQTQFDVLTGIDTKTLSLSDAISRYNESLLSANFTNAQDQLAKLDEISTNAKLQIDALNGIDTSVLSLNDSFINFANAVTAATAGTQQTLLVKMQSLVDEVAALRSESAVYNESIAKNTGSTAANTKSIYKDGVTIIETVPA